ncbi:hypothetical protein Tco_0213801 [Tanacetum coccineum]
MYHDLYLGGKALVERKNVGFDLTKSDLCPSFIKDLSAKSVGHHVADSHTGNHHKDGFTPLESIRRILSIIWERIPFELEGEAFDPERMVRHQALPVESYGCEPSIELFRGFFNLCRGGKWLTFAKRPEKHIPYLFPKVNTRIEGWKGRFFFVQSSIVPAEYLQLLLEHNKWDLKSYKDKLPSNIEENPMFQRLGRYPISVRVFRDPILFLAGLKPSWEYGQQQLAIIVGGKEIAFRNFIYAENEEDLSFLPKDPSSRFGARQEGGSSRPPVKRKIALGSSSSRATSAKISSSKDDLPFLTVSDDDAVLPDVFELKYANACHLKISAITRLAWKDYLDNHLDVELERAWEEECEEIRTKCEAAMTDFEKNPTMVVMRHKISTLSTKAKVHKANLDRMMLESQKWAGYQVSLSVQESKVASLEAEKARLEVVEVSLRNKVDDIKRDMMEFVSKVVRYAALELIHSDELGRLVCKLISSAILYGRCAAFEQVANMKEPFNLLKVKGYQPLYKNEHTQAGNELATATFSWLSEFIANPSAPIKRAIPSSAPASNPMSPPADVSSIKTQSSQECSIAMAKKFKPPGAVGKGPRTLTPQWLNGHTLPAAIASFPVVFFAIDCSLHYAHT